MPSDNQSLYKLLFLDKKWLLPCLKTSENLFGNLAYNELCKLGCRNPKKYNNAFSSYIDICKTLVCQQLDPSKCKRVYYLNKEEFHCINRNLVKPASLQTTRTTRRQRRRKKKNKIKKQIY